MVAHILYAILCGPRLRHRTIILRAACLRYFIRVVWHLSFVRFLGIGFISLFFLAVLASAFSYFCPRSHSGRKTLASAYPDLGPLVLDEEMITLAVNREYVPAGEILVLKPGDEIALIPPISGG
mmetsp:Transcript_5796/g.12271  ORF Transcript_5796/g.12271 Transcript_5796/m.12271 type:complete len:124 (-) Transcript_5796:246-617(-)